MPNVLYEKRDGIAYITLNRPEVHNAIDHETDELLFDAWSDFRADAGLRLAIITGAGDTTFCAGADLKTHIDPGLVGARASAEACWTAGSRAGSRAVFTAPASRSSPRSTGGSSAAASSSRWPATSASRPRTSTSGSSTCAAACISPTAGSSGW
jgi:hypothetical protein